MAKRLGLYFLGILILGFGIVLNTKTGLGVAAINSVPFGISEMTNLSLGMATTILYIIFVGVQLLIYQKLDFKVLLQIPFSYFMGYVLDFYNNLLNFTVTSLPVALVLLPVALVLLAIAILATALGAYVVVTLDLIPNPADGMVKALSQVIDKEFGKTKLLFDCGMMLVTIITTYCLAGKIIGIGIGTILSAGFIGQIIVIYNRYFTKHLTLIVENSRA